ncbi:MAG: PepSY-like domain-containing protein [Candidatus Aminicenantaceae bacterium]
MKHSKWILFGCIVVLAIALTMSTGCTKQEEELEGETQSIDQEGKAEVQLPAAVLKAIEENVPNAEIAKVDIEEKGGIALYDIEFKADQGEIEVAENGTVIDVVTVITMEDVPEAVAEVLKKSAEGATIIRIEKSEVWSEVKMEGEQGTIVKLDSPKYVYEAELMKDDQTGEIEVAADGTVIEPLKWDTEESKEKEK